MKKLFLTLMLASGVLTFAAEQTWTGKISDSKCGVSHKAGEHGASKMSDHDCVVACVKGGAKYAFVRGGKVYNIGNQDFAGLEEHAGHMVRLTGDMSGDTITVSKIEMSSGKTKKTTE
jgi:hypothetical protein